MVFQKILSSFKSKISKINANIDDIYNFSLLHQKKVISQITIEVLSRPKATRNLTIVGEKGKLLFNQEEDMLKVKNVKKNVQLKLKKLNIEKNYTYPEQPYINEMTILLQL